MLRLPTLISQAAPSEDQASVGSEARLFVDPPQHNHNTHMSPSTSNPIELGYNRYGKTHVRLIKVNRHDKIHHSVSELRVQLLLEGDFADSYMKADNSKVVPTDTCKNSIYALAKQNDVNPIESFALVIGRHMVNKYPQVTGCQVLIEKTTWNRTADGEHKHAFQRSEDMIRFCRLSVAGNGDDVRMVSGVRELTLLKTTMSGFVGFDQNDPWTSLPPVNDRLMRSKVYAEWTWANAKQLFNHPVRGAHPNYCSIFKNVVKVSTDRFSGDPKEGTFSASIQQVLYEIGKELLEKHSDLETVFISLPNLHCWEYDMSKVGMKNEGDIYYPADEPYGLIEAYVTRQKRQSHREILLGSRM